MSSSVVMRREKNMFGTQRCGDMVWPQANDAEPPSSELRCASDAIEKHP